ncbi:MAG: NAD(P)/FAD-dependent oxidoreductase [Chlamydiae bacterium]|nr:NAD(P)/FAD-dependent oxidoreductase [Chlamydiota bacterium]
MGFIKVVIVGGGFAGINVAKHLKMAYLDLTLIDKSNHHLFQPLLYQVATAALSPAEIAYPIREIFKDQANILVMMAEVTAIQKEQKSIQLSHGGVIGYDYLVLASGASHSYFGQDHWAPLAPGLKTLQDALWIREKILLSFEIAERLEDLHQAEAYLNFVIIGGGPTGVELAGAIAEIAKTTLPGNFQRIKPETSKIFLIEALPRILPTYSRKLSERAKKDLEHLGVKVISGEKVTHISEEGVQMDGHFLASKNVIWAAGNQASPLAHTLEVPLDAQGRVRVLPDLTLPGHPEIFVIGDMSHVQGPDGLPLPGTAATAVQQGRYVASILNKLNSPAHRKPFCYKDKGSLATIGKGKAIAQLGSLEFSGLLAWLFWGIIHITYLIGFRNRLRVMLEWILVFITGQRGVRIILGKPEFPSKPT